MGQGKFDTFNSLGSAQLKKEVWKYWEGDRRDRK